MNRSRWFRIGFVFGFVLGTKAGRERYEDMRRAWLKVWQTSAVRSVEAKVRTKLSFRRPVTGNGSYRPVGALTDLPGS